MGRVRLLLAPAVALAVAACAKPPGTLWELRISSDPPGLSNLIPVVLGDQTGLVTGLEAVVAEPVGGLAEAAVQRDPQDGKAVILTWATGACDDETVIAFQRAAERFSLDVQVRNGFDMGCTGNLVLRGLRIQLSEPVDASSISVTSNSP